MQRSNATECISKLHGTSLTLICLGVFLTTVAKEKLHNQNFLVDIRKPADIRELSFPPLENKLSTMYKI